MGQKIEEYEVEFVNYFSNNSDFPIHFEAVKNEMKTDKL